MKVAKYVYEFVTGGSLLAPAGLACAIVAALLAPAGKSALFAAIVALTFAASVFEKPS